MVLLPIVRQLVTSPQPPGGGGDPKPAEEKVNEEKTNTQANPINVRPAAAGRTLTGICINENK